MAKRNRPPSRGERKLGWYAYDRSPLPRPARRERRRTAWLNSEQHDTLARNGRKVDEITDADRRYFERFPHRRHRLRLASQAEISDYETLSVQSQTVPAGYRYCVALRKSAPGVRIRVYLFWPVDEETDLDEERARDVFEAHLPPEPLP